MEATGEGAIQGIVERTVQGTMQAFPQRILLGEIYKFAGTQEPLRCMPIPLRTIAEQCLKDKADIQCRQIRKIADVQNHACVHWWDIHALSNTLIEVVATIVQSRGSGCN